MRRKNFPSRCIRPPQARRSLGGEPKTEMWYIAEATPEADLFVGLKRGVTRAEFERKIQDGTVADCFHRVPVKRAMSCSCPADACMRLARAM